MKFNHINIWTDKLSETVAFYGALFGATKGERPAFPFPGEWLYVDGKAVIHLITIDGKQRNSATDYFSEDKKTSSSARTSLHHIAFEGKNLEQFTQTLEKQRIKYNRAEIPGSGEVQLFIDDPNNIKIEIIFLNQKRSA